MTRRLLLCAGALLCLIGMLAVPVTASGREAGIANSENISIDPGLKDELWEIHMQHRLDTFDRNVRAGEDTIAALGSYGYATSELSGILDTIGDMRGELSDALNARDKAALKDINTELRQLWKDYLKEMRQLLKGE